MGKHIVFILFLFSIGVIQSQINFGNIVGPAVFENISSINKNGSSVVSIINGQVTDGKGSTISVITSVSSNSVDSSTAQTLPQEVNVISSIQKTPEEDISIIKGPVLIQSTGSNVTSIQNEQNSNGQVLSIITTNDNNNSQSRDTPSPEDKKDNTTALNEVEPPKSKPSAVEDNNFYISATSTTRKPDNSIIVFPKD